MKISEKDLWSNALVINLADRTDRWDFFLEEFGPRLGSIHRVDAVRGEGDYAHLRQACTLSHLRALDLASEMNLDNFLLFEDDACFNHESRLSIPDALSELPEDFDMLYLGAWTTEYRPFSKNLRRSEWSMLAHAIFFSRRRLDFIREHLRKNSFIGARPVDYLYGDLHLQLNAYTCVPSVVIQRPTFSTIEQRYVDLSEKVNWQDNSTRVLGQP